MPLPLPHPTARCAGPVRTRRGSCPQRTASSCPAHDGPPPVPSTAMCHGSARTTAAARHSRRGCVRVRGVLLRRPGRRSAGRRPPMPAPECRRPGPQGPPGRRTRCARERRERPPPGTSRPTPPAMWRGRSASHRVPPDPGRGCAAHQGQLHRRRSGRRRPGPPCGLAVLERNGALRRPPAPGRPEP